MKSYAELLDLDEALCRKYEDCTDIAECERLRDQIDNVQLVLYHHPDRPVPDGPIEGLESE